MTHTNAAGLTITAAAWHARRAAYYYRQWGRVAAQKYVLAHGSTLRLLCLARQLFVVEEK